MPTASAAVSMRSAAASSSREGVRSPEGWLWLRAIKQALWTRAVSRTGRGSANTSVRDPEETTPS